MIANDVVVPPVLTNISALPLQMPFGIWTRGEGKEAYIRWGADPHTKGQYLGKRHTCLILELCAVIVYPVEYWIYTSVSTLYLYIHAANKTLWYNCMDMIGRYGVTLWCRIDVMVPCNVTLWYQIKRSVVTVQIWRYDNDTPCLHSYTTTLWARVG